MNDARSAGAPRTYVYHQKVLEELARHGLAPLPTTAPDQVREAVSDLYRYEIRRLRADLLAGRVERQHYVTRVVELRRRYWLLSVPTALWVVPREEEERG